MDVIPAGARSTAEPAAPGRHGGTHAVPRDASDPKPEYLPGLPAASEQRHLRLVLVGTNRGIRNTKGSGQAASVRARPTGERLGRHPPLGR